jgi:hypothetical protein
MNRPYEIFKTPNGLSTGKALLNYAILSPSQSGETVPLNRAKIKGKKNNGKARRKLIILRKHM